MKLYSNHNKKCKCYFLYLSKIFKLKLNQEITFFNNRLYRFLIIFLSSFSIYAIPIFKFQHQVLARDWGLFNSLSLFNRSGWLYYHTFPFHNPYIMGGMDVLANPQARALSPNSLFDLIFSAPYANLGVLFSLSIIGTYGFYFLLKYLKVNSFISLFVSILFAHGSWFSLHYSEGHIIFASFQLIGWVLLCILRLNEARIKVYFAAILSFFLLDGAIYAFVHSLILLFFCFVFQLNGISFFSIIKSIVKQWKHSLFAFFIFIGIGGGKLWPLLAMHSQRTPVLENIQLNFISIFNAFFNPFQYVIKEINGSNYLQEKVGFHEIGAYIGFVSLGLILYFLIKEFSKKLVPFILIFLMFLWIGTGLFKEINPWILWQKIPIINNAHVQTRALFFVFFFAMIFLAFALNAMVDKLNWSLKMTLYSFLLLEALFISNYPYHRIFMDRDSVSDNKVFKSLIKNSTIDATFCLPSDLWGFDFNHYLRINKGSKLFMDPSLKQGKIRGIEDFDYKGEIYFLQGKGEAKILSYTPGSIVLSIQQDSTSVIQLNTNYLLGWKSNNSKVYPFSNNGLLTIKTNLKSVKLKLHYSPYYFYPVILLYLFAVFLLGVFVFIDTKRNYFHFK